MDAVKLARSTGDNRARRARGVSMAIGVCRGDALPKSARQSPLISWIRPSILCLGPSLLTKYAKSTATQLITRYAKRLLTEIAQADAMRFFHWWYLANEARRSQSREDRTRWRERAKAWLRRQLYWRTRSVAMPTR